MNKIQAVSLALLAISSSAYAGTTSGGSATAATSVAVSTTDCTGLKEAVTVQLSAGNFGAVNCPSATASGVGVANMKGKGKSFAASSNGGALTEGTFTITSGTDGGAGAAASTAASTAAGASS